MKILICSLFMLTLFLCSQNKIKKAASIEFYKAEYNFGELRYKQEAEYFFEFTNPGKMLLVIYNVETSCGCTAAAWTKEPVKPGKSGQIVIKYDAAFLGTFEKTITVHYNGKDSPAILTIKGKVAYPEDVDGPKE